jgi:hypothetical protein
MMVVPQRLVWCSAAPGHFELWFPYISSLVQHHIAEVSLACLVCPQVDDGGAAETRVVQLLGLDHFELAKELLKNRLKIVWVIRLKQAQDEAEVCTMKIDVNTAMKKVQLSCVATGWIPCGHCK